MSELTLISLKRVARDYVLALSEARIRELHGTTDGKAVGTYVEHGFHEYLRAKKFKYARGSSANGIDFPSLDVDLKVTSINQPQSSCPFRSASQKVFGLGYHLLIFIYEKTDDSRTRVARLNFRHAVFVDRERTADYQTTSGLRELLDRNGNKDDIVAFLEDRNLPLDEIGRSALAEEILKRRPELGCLTVSNALQWRLQYGRVVGLASNGETPGVESILA